MKKFVKVVTVFLVLVLLSSAAAAQMYLPPTNNYGSGSDFGTRAFDYLYEGVVFINYQGEGTYLLYGHTMAHLDVSRIIVEITPQQWNGSSWVDGTTYDNERNNDDFVICSRSVTVPRNYYYRLKGKHTVIHNGKTEVSFSYSTPVYAN